MTLLFSYRIYKLTETVLQHLVSLFNIFIIYNNIFNIFITEMKKIIQEDSSDTEAKN